VEVLREARKKIRVARIKKGWGALMSDWKKGCAESEKKFRERGHPF
jgi:hypothetical protein